MAVVVSHLKILAHFLFLPILPHISDAWAVCLESNMLLWQVHAQGGCQRVEGMLCSPGHNAPFPFCLPQLCCFSWMESELWGGGICGSLVVLVWSSLGRTSSNFCGASPPLHLTPFHSGVTVTPWWWVRFIFASFRMVPVPLSQELQHNRWGNLNSPSALAGQGSDASVWAGLPSPRVLTLVWGAMGPAPCAFWLVTSNQQSFPAWVPGRVSCGSG